MPGPSAAFEATYRFYLERIASLDLPSVAKIVGGRYEGDSVLMPFLQRTYRVSPEGVADLSGRTPHLSVSVVLCKHLLMCPRFPPENRGWVTYKDFPDAAPLIGYFSHNAEGAVVKAFQGRKDDLRTACDCLAGLPFDMDVSYDVATRIDALPRVPVAVLFNDADEEFPAQCTLLFEQRAGAYLDMECLGMLGALLAESLERAAL
ncbi:DUF3786 domain-containing protein [Thermodesulfobacteriota bacterium]